MDIRNFFNAKAKNQPTSKNDVVKNRPKPIISDSSDDEMKNGPSPKKHHTKKSSVKRDDNQNKRVAKRRLSNSSSDEFEDISNKKGNSKSRKVESETVHNSKNTSSKNGSTKTNSSNGDQKLKPVNVDDFFSSSTTTVKESKNKKSPIKRKSPIKTVEEHDDPNFSAMLVAMDNKKEEQKRRKSPKSEVVKESSNLSSKTSKGNHEERKTIVKDNSLSSKLSAKHNQHTTKVGNEKHKNKSPCKKGIQAATSNGKDIKTAAKPTESHRSLSQSSDKSSQERSLSQSTQSQGSTVIKAEQDKPSQLWVDKYKPTTTKGIIGQQGDKSNMKKLQAWLRGWEKYHGVTASGKPPTKPPPWGAAKDDGSWAKAALLSGPPGVGKTTTSYLVAKEMGYEIMETNASDTRSKKKLDTEISDALSNTSVANHKVKR